MWKTFHCVFTFPHFLCFSFSQQASCKILQRSSSREIRICLLQSSCFYLLSLQSANANPVYTAWKTTSRPIHFQQPIVLSISLTLLCNLCLSAHLGAIWGSVQNWKKGGFWDYMKWLIYFVYSLLIVRNTWMCIKSFYEPGSSVQFALWGEHISILNQPNRKRLLYALWIIPYTCSGYVKWIKMKI